MKLQFYAQKRDKIQFYAQKREKILLPIMIGACRKAASVAKI